MQQAQSLPRSRGARRRTDVLLVGHSYIRRLGRFMDDNPDCRNLGFNPEEVAVHCIGQGGTVLRPGDRDHCILSLLSTALACQPVIVFLHIGENDVRELSPDDISAAVVLLMHYMSAVSPGCDNLQ